MKKLRSLTKKSKQKDPPSPFGILDEIRDVKNLTFGDITRLFFEQNVREQIKIFGDPEFLKYLVISIIVLYFKSAWDGFVQGDLRAVFVLVVLFAIYVALHALNLKEKRWKASLMKSIVNFKYFVDHVDPGIANPHEKMQHAVIALADENSPLVRDYVIKLIATFGRELKENVGDLKTELDETAEIVRDVNEKIQDIVLNIDVADREIAEKGAQTFIDLAKKELEKRLLPKR